jgi:hypothetical protein
MLAQKAWRRTLSKQDTPYVPNFNKIIEDNGN